MDDALPDAPPGVFLVPGVSKNRRLYTKEMIAKAVARMQSRIADPDGLPIVMRTHHDAKDNSRLIVGRVTSVEQDERGRGRFNFQWYNTSTARDIAALVQPEDGSPPGLRSVSIHGWFIGPSHTEVDGESVTTAQDLEVDAIDFTASPGVAGALIERQGERSESMPARPGCLAISETWEDPMPESAAGHAEPVVDEAPEDEAYTAAQKRDALAKGQAMKNADGKPSYTIKNKADLRRAIRAVGRGGADHDAIRKHVIARAKALGLSAMIPDNWNADGSLKETALATRFGEIRECYDCGPDGRAGFAIDAYNGPVSLTLRAPSLDPSGLRAIATAAITAALDALGALDPDFDADIDIPGAPDADSDGDMGAGEAAPEDPDAATVDDDEDDPQPGDACPCACGCAVPAGDSAGPGCPCACGCQVCGAAAPESAPPPGAQPSAGESAFQGEPGPELEPVAAATPISAPEPAPVPIPTIEESAVSETATPAAEAATPAPVPAPETAPTPQPTAPVIQLTQEQFRDLLAAVRPPAVETAAPASTTPEPAVEDAAPRPTPASAQESDPAAGVEEAVTAALAKALPALRDSIVSQYGLPPRKGFRTTEADANGGEMTTDQMWDNRADLLLGSLGKAPAAG